MQPLVPRLLASMAVCLLASSPALGDALPTQEQIQQAYEKGDYPQALRGLQRTLALKGEAAKPYDRHALMRIKAETHLRMKANAAAASAFNDAAAETKDPAAAAEDRATALLIERSRGGNYAPRAAGKGKPPAEPIPILAPDHRKDALVALFADEFAAAQPRIQAARGATQLGPLLDMLPLARDLRVLELAAHGDDAQTKALVTRLAALARDLMGESIKRMAGTVDIIDKSANDWVQYDEVSRDPATGGVRSIRMWKKRGINRDDGLRLQQVIAVNTQIGNACRDIADAFGISSVDFGPVRADAGKLARRTDILLRADYSRGYRTRPQ